MAKVVAKQYAKALFSLAQEEQILEVVYEQLQFLHKQMREEEMFFTFMQHPKVASEDKKYVLDTLFQDKFSVYVLNFLKLLVDKRRFVYIDDMIQFYEVLYRKEKGIVFAQVWSAKELLDEEMKQIEKLLVKKYAKQVEIRYAVHPELVAGVKIMVDGEVIDHSLRHRLQQLRMTLHTSAYK